MFLILGRTTFVRCVLDHNQARLGGAFHAQVGTVLVLEQCTIADNVAYFRGGGLDFEGSGATLTLQNSIVWGNEGLGGADEIYLNAQSMQAICSDVRQLGVDAQGGTVTWDDCIDADPRFCDAAGWEYPDYPSDYHLRSDSPCLPVSSPCGALIGTLGEGCLAPGVGACCIGTECFVRTEADCAQQLGSYQGDGTTCDPDPCVPIPVEQTTWGRIKAQYRSMPKEKSPGAQ